MFYVEGSCPICGTGTRGFRMCSDKTSIVVMCDECDSIWLDAERLQACNVVYAEPPEYLLPGLACSIAAPSSKWATRTEVEACGWGDLISGEGKALDGG